MHAVGVNGDEARLLSREESASASFEAVAGTFPRLCCKCLVRPAQAAVVQFE